MKRTLLIAVLLLMLTGCSDISNSSSTLHTETSENYTETISTEPEIYETETTVSEIIETETTASEIIETETIASEIVGTETIASEIIETETVEYAQTEEVNSEYIDQKSIVEPQVLDTEPIVESEGSKETESIQNDTPIATDPQSEQIQQTQATTYVLNTNTKKIHHPSCSSVAQIKPKNYQETESTVEELESQGYVKCKKCF